MAGKEGYSPEEIQALRVKLAGNSVAPLGKDVTEFDRKASDVSGSLSRLGDNQYVKGVLAAAGGGNPIAPMLRDAVEQADLARKGGIGGLSKATQSALAAPQAPEQLTALQSPTPNVEAAPSLRDQFLSKLRGNVGGVGGDPLSSLRAAFMSAQQKQLGDFNRDKELAGEMGENKAQHAMTMADWQIADAEKKRQDAIRQQQIDEKAHEEHQKFLAQNQQMVDDVAKSKVDPQRLMKSMGTGEKVAHVLGSALGGFLSGAQGGPNQFLQRFDQQVAQDIQAQMDEIDNKKTALGARQNMFGQLLAMTGDRRIAAQQMRNLHYEAAKQFLAATDAQLGVPELQTAAQQNINALQHQQDQMGAQISAQALQQKQQQLAAQAAAQAAAQKHAEEMMLKLADLGLRKDELAIKAAQVNGGSIEDLNKQAMHLGEKLADPALAQGRAAVENAKQRLAAAGEGNGLPGVGKWADIRSTVLGDRWGLSDEERVSRGDWEKIKLAYRKQITGSGGSAEEMKTIERAFEGAKTPAEQRNAIAEADAFFKQIEFNHKRSVDPRALNLVEGRGAAVAGIQPRAGKGDVSDERAKQFKKKLAGGY